MRAPTAATGCADASTPAPSTSPPDFSARRLPTTCRHRRARAPVHKGGRPVGSPVKPNPPLRSRYQALRLCKATFVRRWPRGRPPWLALRFAGLLRHLFRVLKCGKTFASAAIGEGHGPRRAARGASRRPKARSVFAILAAAVGTLGGAPLIERFLRAGNAFPPESS
jgi:hypothetical protein